MIRYYFYFISSRENIANNGPNTLVITPIGVYTTGFTLCLAGVPRNETIISTRKSDMISYLSAIEKHKVGLILCLNSEYLNHNDSCKNDVLVDRTSAYLYRNNDVFVERSDSKQVRFIQRQDCVLWRCSHCSRYRKSFH